MQVVVDEEGRVIRPRISGQTKLELAVSAIRSVCGWRFEPATIDGEPVSVYSECVDVLNALSCVF